MGATSVTGVGPGSVEGVAKGPKERGFVGAEKLIGPRVVAAGHATLVGGAYTVTLTDPLPGFTPASVANNSPEDDYVVMVTDTTTPGTSITATKVASDVDGDGNNDHLASLTIAGTGTHEFDWIVFKVGGNP